MIGSLLDGIIFSRNARNTIAPKGTPHSAISEVANQCLTTPETTSPAALPLSADRVVVLPSSESSSSSTSSSSIIPPPIDVGLANANAVVGIPRKYTINYSTSSGYPESPRVEPHHEWEFGSDSD